MRALPILMRLADDMRRIALSSSSPFYEDPWRLYRMASPWSELRHLENHHDDAIPKIGKDGYQVSVDVADFKPNELKVKVVDNSVVVEGKHEEREDEGGYVSRKFVRRYELPKGFDPERVMSTLSSDGVLTVSVPKPQIENSSNERLIQIHQTGPAHINVKENSMENQEKLSSSSSSSSSSSEQKPVK